MKTIARAICLFEWIIIAQAFGLSTRVPIAPYAVLPKRHQPRALEMISNTCVEQSSSVTPIPSLYDDIPHSTLGGKAIAVYSSPDTNFPSVSEIRSVIPEECYVKDTRKSLAFAFMDVATTSLCVLAGIMFMLPRITPVAFSSNPITSIFAVTLYSIMTGTAAIGAWVTAHEAGHFAFSDNLPLQTAVGFLFHSALLVPYFSWQRSHSVHHGNTNHIYDGETHVPPVKSNGKKTSFGLTKSIFQAIAGKKIGNIVFGSLELVKHLIFGWPAYLLTGITGGPSRGVTNHFLPFPLTKPTDPSKELFHRGNLKSKVIISDLGVAAFLAGLAMMASKFGITTMLALYGGPLIIVNAWLVAYTWLQHTDTDVPHLSSAGGDYSFVKGAFLTIDRPYEKLMWGIIDFLHHHIGSTHVVHHLDSTIPHYNARKATEAIKKAFPNLYLREETPIFQALWRISSKCFEVERRGGSYNEGKELFVFTDV